MAMAGARDSDDSEYENIVQNCSQISLRLTILYAFVVTSVCTVLHSMCDAQVNYELLKSCTVCELLK